MRQNDIKFDLQSALGKIIKPAASKTVDYFEPDITKDDDEYFPECDSHHVGFSISALCMCGLSPMATSVGRESIKASCEKLEICNSDYFARRSIYRDRTDYYGLDVAEDVERAMKKAKKAFGGLCLDCVKEHKKLRMSGQSAEFRILTSEGWNRTATRLRSRKNQRQAVKTKRAHISKLAGRNNAGTNN
jgi:hypothetical protein